MFKGFLECFRFINDDLEIIFSNGLDSNCNYNMKLALSDIHNLMTEYKNEKKSVLLSMLNGSEDKLSILLCILIIMISEKTEQGEFNRKFPDAIASYPTHVDIKTLRLLLKKIEYLLSWVDESKLKE